MGKSAAVTVAEAVHLVPIVQLAIWPGNPRHTVDNFDLKDLVASIKSKGIQEPLKVRKRSDGQLEIYCGKRRYLAAKASGLASVPCIIRQIKDEDIMELAIIDNLQREDVDVIEEAQAIADLYAKRKSWKDVSSVLGKEPRELAAKAVLSRLSKEGQSLLHAGRMTLGTAKLIAPLDQEGQKDAIKRVRDRNWGADQVKRFIHDDLQMLLSSAPWKKDDAKLYPAAGACTTCPKATNTQPELFGAGGKEARCLDRGCYQTKLARVIEAVEEKIKAAGGKHVRISTDYNPPAGMLKREDYRFTKPGCKSPETFGVVCFGKDMAQTRRVCLDKNCKVCRKDWERGDSRKADRTAAASARAAKKRTRRENAVRAAIFRAVNATRPVNLSDVERTALVRTLYSGLDFEGAKQTCDALELKAKGDTGIYGTAYRRALVEYFTNSPGQEKKALLLFPAITGLSSEHYYQADGWKTMQMIALHHGVKIVRVRNETLAALDAKKKKAAKRAGTAKTRKTIKKGKK